MTKIIGEKHSFLACGLAWLTLMLLCASCAEKTEQGVENRVPFQKSYVQESLRLDYQLDRTVLHVADRIVLTLKVEAPENMIIRFPDFAEEFGRFKTLDQYEERPQLGREGSLLHQKKIVLEPLLAGEHTLPVFEMQYGEKGVEIAWKLISTDSVTITVNSYLDSSDSLPDISDIQGPVMLPANKWFIVMLIASGLLVMLAALWFFKARKIQSIPAAPPTPPAHITALQALNELLAADLIARGEIKQFYSMVSDILRHYIEQRFQLRAPERTTEEFLYELGESRLLQYAHKNLLREFLVHCDQVKFARYQPDQEEIHKTEKLCRRFINETKQATETGGVEK